MIALQEQPENVSVESRKTRSTFDREFRLETLKTKLRMTPPCCRLDQPDVRYQMLPAKLVLGTEDTRHYQAYAKVLLAITLPV